MSAVSGRGPSGRGGGTERRQRQTRSGLASGRRAPRSAWTSVRRRTRSGLVPGRHAPKGAWTRGRCRMCSGLAPGRRAPKERLDARAAPDAFWSNEIRRQE
ncbi:hypothetical protein O6H91_09G114800 [Diphasiastrum complanatum]|uniref:Uncharacterized protein n=1 Tax=Diphasiastrum complanatum TaxID=34168 RepID=A0ACC2CTG5_DIPCM|nr:hypothetical protein O6H91_09G114800 [Diphasiastrum complanatum]